MPSPPVLAPLAPRIPHDLTPLRADTLTDDTAWNQARVDGDAGGVSAEDVEISESHLERARLTGSGLERARLTDVLIDGCDLSGTVLESAVLTRVELRGCRLSGFVATRADLRHVRFVDCRMDAASFRMAKGTRVAFEGCDLGDADFTSVSFEHARWFDCQLRAAEFSRAKVVGARLHGSALDAIKGAEHLKGVVVDSGQIVPLALRVFAALGVTVDDERESATPPPAR